MVRGIPPSRHPYTWSGRQRAGQAGRAIFPCATCGAAENSPQHRGQPKAADPRLDAAKAKHRRAGWAAYHATARARRQEEAARLADLERVTVAPDVPAGMVPTADLPSPAPPPIYVRRDHLGLALALDAVLEADSLPVTAVVYATALRAVLDVPRWAVTPPRPETGASDRLQTISPEPSPPEPLVEAVDLARVGPGPRRNGHATPVAVPGTGRSGLVTGIRNDRLRALTVRAQREGWAVAETGGGHVRLTPPDGGRPVVLSQSAGDTARTWRNARAEAKRRGLDVTGI